LGGNELVSFCSIVIVSSPASFQIIKKIQTMPTVIIRHKVGDFDTWIKGRQDRMDLFGPVTNGLQEFQDTNDPNSVVLVANVTDMDKLNEMMQDPNVQKKKDEHTVIDPLIISMPLA
jgi:hypothetical protein